MEFTKDYGQYGVEDFATDKLFRSWVLDNDPKATAFWKYWLLENPTKTPIIEQAKQLLLKVKESQLPIEEKDIDKAVDKIFMQINAHETAHSGKNSRLFVLNTYRIAAMAATILLAAVGLWWFSSQKPKNTEGGQVAVVEQKRSTATKEQIKTVNDEEYPLPITLSDGSVVTLNRGSKLTYPNVFNADSRVVYLEGAAFFEVTKNPSKPFLVHAQGVVTKVLGTSFRIDAFDKNVKVMVKTGKVAVFTENNNKESDYENQAIVLTPNQEVVFQSTANRFEKSVQETPTLLITNVKIKDLHFEDAPIISVFNALKEAYGIEIIYDEDVMKNCMITTSLTDEPLFEKLTIICKTIGASYRQLDAKIIINGRGCK